MFDSGAIRTLGGKIMENANAFGKNLMLLRKQAGLSRKAMADFFKIPVTTLQGYEVTGKEPRYSMLIKIADHFNVTTDWLLRDHSDSDRQVIFSMNDTVDNVVFQSTIPREKIDLFTTAGPVATQIFNSIMQTIEQADRKKQPLDIDFSIKVNPSTDTDKIEIEVQEENKNQS